VYSESASVKDCSTSAVRDSSTLTKTTILSSSIYPSNSFACSSGKPAPTRTPTIPPPTAPVARPAKPVVPAPATASGAAPGIEIKIPPASNPAIPPKIPPVSAP